MRKAVIGLALATTLLATPSFARDDSMYAGIEGGVIFGDSLGVDYDADGDDDIGDDETNLIELKTDTGFDVDAVIGYDFGGFRLEAEGGYKKLGVDRVESEAFDLNPATTAVDTGYDVDGDLKVKSLMLNALADIGQDGGLQFYGGGGVGMGWVDLDGDIEGVATPFVDDSDSGLAWQLIAGLRFPVSDNVDLGLKYRFFNVEDLNMVSPTDERFETDFSSHSVLASLLFNFGGASAPPPPPPPPAPPPPPPPPPPPTTRTCPDGTVVGATQACPVPPPPPAVAPTGERG